jgi:hypothetical protein
LRHYAIALPLATLIAIDWFRFHIDEYIFWQKNSWILNIDIRWWYCFDYISPATDTADTLTAFSPFSCHFMPFSRLFTPIDALPLPRCHW